MLIHFISCLLYFDITKTTFVYIHVTTDGIHDTVPFQSIWSSSQLFSLDIFSVLFRPNDWLLFNVKCFSCIHNKTLHTPCVFCLYKSFILTNVPSKVVSSNPVHGEVYSNQHDVIKFVSDLRHQQSKRNYPLNQSHSYLHWIHYCLRLTYQSFYPPLQTNHDGLLQNIHHNHLNEWYLFSPWSNREIAHLVLKSNHSPIHWYTFLYTDMVDICCHMWSRNWVYTTVLPPSPPVF
jgi:hypothetical protein